MEAFCPSPQPGFFPSRISLSTISRVTPSGYRAHNEARNTGSASLRARPLWEGSCRVRNSSPSMGSPPTNIAGCLLDCRGVRLRRRTGCDCNHHRLRGPVNGTELVGSEFAGVTISSSDKGTTHAGPAIFDSSKPGPNDSGGDKDLLLGLGLVALATRRRPRGSGLGTPESERDSAGSQQSALHNRSLL